MIKQPVQDENQIMLFTSQIVSSYLENNTVSLDQIANVVDVVHQKVADIYLSAPKHAGAGSPAVAIEESITPDHIICLEDGKKFKMLKKHLRAQYDMSPEEYRAKWNLPVDYPMVAPNYAMRRQELARASGLGKSRRQS
ncbi:MAG: MucR family transcriptional regulator [Rhodobacteraceae bacterium]|nr:MucR family transcriptional regulator [Paracoccaceae bacterium]